MDELIEALQFIKQFMINPNDRYFASAEHDVWYLHGIDVQKMKADDVIKIYNYGFLPGFDNDYYSDELRDIEFENLTDEIWDKYKDAFNTSLHSYRYGSC